MFLVRQQVFYYPIEMPPKIDNPQAEHPGEPKPQPPSPIELADVEPVLLELPAPKNQPPPQPQPVAQHQPGPVMVTEPQPKSPQMTVVERANYMIDFVNDSVFNDILSGLQLMHKRRPMHEQEEEKSKNKRTIEKVVDIDAHKRMIRKFMKANRRSLRGIQQRFTAFQEQSRRVEEEVKKKREEERSKTLEVRREQINNRRLQREQFNSQLKKSMLVSNSQLKKLKETKLLYKQREQAFKQNYLLPRIEEEKRIIMQRRQEMRQPLDLSSIAEHQKLYQEKRVQDKVNRSMTSRVAMLQNHYQPPKFVPKSFKIMEAEESIRKEEEKLKAQEHQMNEYRKKEFLRVIEERQKHEHEQSLEKSLQRSKSGGKKRTLGSVVSLKREKVKPAMSKEESTKVGNDYLKSVLADNKKKRVKAPKTQQSSENSFDTRRKARSSYQIQLVREERIEKVQKVRLRHIEGLLHNQAMNKHEKKDRLEYEVQRFDELLAKEERNEGDEVGNLVVSSIHTKLALLEVTRSARQ